MSKCGKGASFVDLKSRFHSTMFYVRSTERYRYLRSYKVNVLSHFGRVRFFATLCTIACQAPLSMRFCRKEYWRGSSCTSEHIFPTQGLNPNLLHCRVILYQLSQVGSPHTCICKAESLLCTSETTW